MQSIDIEADTPQTGELLPEALATAYGGMHMDSWIEKLLAMWWDDLGKTSQNIFGTSRAGEKLIYKRTE